MTTKFPIDLPEPRPTQARKRPKKTRQLVADIDRAGRVGQEIAMINGGHSISMIADTLRIDRKTIREDITRMLADLEDFRHSLGESYITIHLEMLYRGAEIALKKWDTDDGPWQEGRNYFTALADIARLLDLYPKDGNGNAGVQTVLKVQFNQYNHIPERGGASAASEPDSPIQRMMALMASNEPDNVEEGEIILSPASDDQD